MFTNVIMEDILVSLFTKSLLLTMFLFFLHSLHFEQWWFVVFGTKEVGLGSLYPLSYRVAG